MAFIINVGFLIKQHQKKFPPKALVWIDIGVFPLQQHLKIDYDLLIVLACACLPPFEQHIGQQMVQL